MRWRSVPAATASPATARISCIRSADLILAIGTGLNRHPLTTPPLPSGVRIIHATNDTRDLHKSYATEVALLGDAKLALAALTDAVKDRLGGRLLNRSPAEEIATQARGLAGEVAGEADLGRDADHAVSRHQRIHARGRSGRRDRHA